jgi:hypothetical protein
MKAELSTLDRIDPRTVWPSEARDFTPWLAENIGKLGEVLGLELEATETEAAVGEFSVDILAKDLATDEMVIIENQYGQTNHEHLGKLLTYAGGFDAVALIWIAEAVRDEHRQALEWMNERTDEHTSVFAVELEVLRIANSPPAPNFKIVVAPNKWQKTARASSKGPSEKGEAYRKYFQSLIDELREKHHFTGARTASAQNWYSFSSGISGITYSSSFAQGKRARAEVYVDRGNLEENKKLFDWLKQKKDSIEKSFGSELTWERLDGKRASRIANYRPGSIEDSEATLVEIRSWAIQQLLQFKKTFEALLKEGSALT